MMIHRKNNHIEKVRACKDQNKCQFRPCWFKHVSNPENRNEEVSSNVAEKLNLCRSPMKKTPPPQKKKTKFNKAQSKSIVYKEKR